MPWHLLRAHVIDITLCSQLNECFRKSESCAAPKVVQPEGCADPKVRKLCGSESCAVRRVCSPESSKVVQPRRLCSPEGRAAPKVVQFESCAAPLCSPESHSRFTVFASLFRRSCWPVPCWVWPPVREASPTRQSTKEAKVRQQQVVVRKLQLIFRKFVVQQQVVV